MYFLTILKEKRREISAVIAQRNFDQQINVHRKKYEEVCGKFIER